MMIVLLTLVSTIIEEVIAKEDSVCDDRWHDGSHLHMGCILISKQTPFSTYSEAVAFCGRKNAHIVEGTAQLYTRNSDDGRPFALPFP